MCKCLCRKIIRLCVISFWERQTERERDYQIQSLERERERMNIFRDTVGRKKTCRFSNSLNRGGNRGQNSRFLERRERERERGGEGIRTRK